MTNPTEKSQNPPQNPPAAPLPANKPSGETNPKETPSHPEKTDEEKQAEIEEEHRQKARKDVENVHEDIMKAKTPDDKRREDLLREIGEIIKDYGQESDIPVPHKYWDLTGQYRALANK